MINNKKIYCVWYPSGGFGHFINAVLSLHAKDFARPLNKLTFSAVGHSHDLNLIAPKYSHNPKNYQFDFSPQFNYSVLIDNGIGNETSEKFREVFSGAEFIKLCYTDTSWPTIARTMIDKAMGSNIEQQLPTWDNANWAIREKYFLFLRDHEFRSCWKSRKNKDWIVYIDDLFEYQKIYNALESCGIELTDFNTLWQQWREANAQYIDPVEQAKNIVDNVKHHMHRPLNDITDIWSQAVVYYFIWLEFGIEVPHNDYSDWFTNTKDIVIMLQNSGVIV